MSAGVLPIDPLEQAYGDNRSLLVRYLAGKLDNHHSAEDLVQEIFLALPHVRRDPPIRNPRGFLFRMATNLAINLNLQEARRAALRTEHADILWTAIEEITPERHLLGDEALNAINGAIAELPDRTREILSWRRLDNVPNVEIARRLGISTTAVEKHLRKAMAHLARAIGAGTSARG
jgi:RNA polymerase sigma-70 factor (ECF subfamily)